MLRTMSASCAEKKMAANKEVFIDPMHSYAKRLRPPSCGDHGYATSCTQRIPTPDLERPAATGATRLLIESQKLNFGGSRWTEKEKECLLAYMTTYPPSHPISNAYWRLCASTINKWLESSRSAASCRSSFKRKSISQGQELGKDSTSRNKLTQNTGVTKTEQSCQTDITLPAYKIWIETTPRKSVPRCPLCRLKFESEDSWQDHVVECCRQYRNKNYECKFEGCTYGTNKLYNFKHHQALKHQKDDDAWEAPDPRSLSGDFSSDDDARTQQASENVDEQDSGMNQRTSSADNFSELANLGESWIKREIPSPLPIFVLKKENTVEGYIFKACPD